MLHRKVSILLVTLLIFFVFTTKVFSQIDYKILENGTFDLSITNLEEIMIDDSHDNEFESYTLVEASLIAEGLTDSNYINEVTQKLNEIIKGIRSTPNFISLSETAKAKLALTYLHQNLFRTYIETETSALEVLRSGRFNCVSSSIIYNYVVESLNIDSKGFIVPSHAFSVVYADGKNIEVQTTSPNGFSPSSALKEEFERLTGFDYVSINEQNGENKVMVENPKLISVQYSNLAAFTAQRTRNYNKALSYAIKALMVYPEFKDAKTNMVSILLKWIQYMTDNQRQYEEAIDFNKRSIELLPENEGLKDNLVYVYSRYSNALTISKNGEDYTKAISILEEGKDYFTEVDYKNEFDELIKINYINHAGSLNNKARYEEALAVIDEGLSKYPDEQRLKDLKVDVYSNYALHLSSNGDKKAIDIIGNAMNEFSSRKRKEKLSNKVIDVYENLWSERMKHDDYKGAFDIIRLAENNLNLTDKIRKKVDSLTKRTYINRINHNVKNSTDKSFQQALTDLLTLYTNFKKDRSIIRTANYTLQKYSDFFLNNKKPLNDVLSEYSELLSQTKDISDLFKEVKFYTGYYIKMYIQNQWDNSSSINDKKATLNLLDNIIYDVFTDFTLKLIGVEEVREIDIEEDLKPILNLNNAQVKDFEDNGLEREDLDILNIKDYYFLLYQQYIHNIVDEYSYQSAIDEFFSTERIRDNQTLKNALYSFILRNAQREDKKQTSLEAYKYAYSSYDQGNEELVNRILSIYVDNAKNQINMLAKNEPENISDDITDEERQIIQEAVNFFDKNDLIKYEQTYYINVSNHAYRSNNIKLALAYSKEGYLESKAYIDKIESDFTVLTFDKDIEDNHELLKKNTITLYINRAYELLNLNQNTEEPYSKPIQLLEESLDHFTEEERKSLQELLTEFIEKSKE
jgi:hypothetical protein